MSDVELGHQREHVGIWWRAGAVFPPSQFSTRPSLRCEFPLAPNSRALAPITESLKERQTGPSRRPLLLGLGLEEKY